MALNRLLRPAVRWSCLAPLAWGALLLVLTGATAWAGAPMLYGYEDALGQLRLSDRKLSDQYVAICPYDDGVKNLDFQALRKIVRQKAAERKTAEAKSPGQFWVSSASTPRLAKPGNPYWGDPRLVGRATPYATDFGGWRERQPGRSAPSGELLKAIKLHSQRRQVDPHLIYALIEAESNFQVNAVSPKGAQGLMQIMPETGRQLGLVSPFDPDRNIEAGVRYLRLMLDKFGGLPQALAAYNAGPGCVEQHGGVPPIPETMQYVAKVMARYDALKRESIYLPAARQATGETSDR